jgi:DNA-binding transcriptional MerR regulator
MAHRPSTVDRLDPEIKRLIADLRLEHGWNIDEIKQKLDELKQPISRTALARHTKSLDEISRELRQTRETARVLTEATTPGEDGKVLQLASELLESSMVRMMTATEGGELITLEPKEAMQTSITLHNLVKSKGGLNDIRTKAKAEQKKESAETAKGAAQAAGLSKDTVDAIYHAVLGVEA